MKCFNFIPIFTVLFSINSIASSYVVRAPFEISNGDFTLRVSPKDSALTLKKVGSTDTLFKFVNVDGHSDYFISKNGRFIIVIADSYVQMRDTVIKGVKRKKYVGTDYFGPHWAVKFIDTQTSKFKEIGYDEICKKPKKDDPNLPPHGDFWWVWRKEAQVKDDSLVIQLPFKRRWACPILVD